jgi:hypothetical protein
MSQVSRAEGCWWTVTAVLILLFAITSVAFLLDRRRIAGESVWAKPMKFEASLALHFATLALASSTLSEQSKWGDVLWVTAVASIASTAFEVVYIIVQAARQQASHFNRTTPFYAAMYLLMAIGAVVITISAAVVGGAVLSDANAAAGPALHAGLAIGLIGGAILTLITAFRMGGALNHHAGVEPPSAPRVPITGWSLTVGDRRVPHFLATHMMQAVPLAGLALDRLFAAPIAIGGVLGVAAVWIAATLITFRQANAGLPLTRWPDWKTP